MAPMIGTFGAAAAGGFGGVGGGGVPKEDPGSYTFNVGFAGLATSGYEPQGYNEVSLILYGSGGLRSDGQNSFSSYGRGTRVNKSGVPISGLSIYTPSGTLHSAKTSQWPSGGNGGNGGPAGNSVFRGGSGGAVTAAVWPGGTLVAAGAGGGSGSESRATDRRGWPEGSSHPTSYSNASGTNGGNGGPGGCYYGGGGGGGGYAVGGNGGAIRNGGNPGGNGNPVNNSLGSFGFDSAQVDSNQAAGYAVMSWG